MMEMEEKTIRIINDGIIKPEIPITIHMSYNESLTLKELSELLDSINKAINDVNRKYGIKSNTLLGKEYAAKVAGVDSGSIVVHILTCFIAPVALSILANYLYDRLKTFGAKKEKKTIKTETAYPIIIYVYGSDCLIEFNITKPSNDESHEARRKTDPYVHLQM